MLMIVMRKTLIVCSLCLLVGASAAQQRRAAENVKEYRSPDSAVLATVTSTKAPEATDESCVELRTSAGKLLARIDYSSRDGEHGYGVVKARWTPDSRFFVYSLESSGGHSAWHSPVQYFSCSLSKILSLDDAVHDAVMNPQFTIAAPDHVTVELYFSKEARTVSLSTLHKNR
jgi:hypothetical protein